MITCTKTENGFCLDRLSADDLELIQDAIIHMFNVTNKKDHRSFRKQVLEINRPIDAELEKLEYEKQDEKRTSPARET